MASCHPGGKPSEGTTEDPSATTPEIAQTTIRISDDDGIIQQTTGYAGRRLDKLPTKTGYKPTLYTDSNKTSPVSTALYPQEGILDLYIQWAPIEYTVVFDAGRGQGTMESIKLKYDENAELPACTFTAREETFDCWMCKNTDGTYTQYFDESPIMNLADTDGAVITLTAAYEAQDSTHFTVDEKGNVLSYNGNAAVVRFPDKGRYISSDVFANNEYAGGIRKIVVPNGYESIEQGAFAGCEKLEELRVPFVGGSAYENNFLAYVFGADTYKDSTFSFQGEVSSNSLTYTNQDFSKLKTPQTLKTVAITQPVTFIADGAFYSTYALERVVFADATQLVRIGKSAFESCPQFGYDSEYGMVNALNWLANVKYIGDHAFAAYITEPNAEGGSYICTRLYQIPSLKNIETIGDYAFYQCIYLSELSLGEGLRSIGRYTFFHAASLTELTLPDSLQTVGAYAFCSTGVVELHVGKNIAEIGSFAFAANESLANVYLAAPIPAKISTVPFSNDLTTTTSVSGDRGYKGIFMDDFRIYVNADTVDEYALRWSRYSDFLVGAAADTENANVSYFGIDENGNYDAKLEIGSDGLVKITDPELVLLNSIDLYSRRHNTFRYSVKETYTLTAIPVELPDGVSANGDERFYRISHPLIVGEEGEAISFLLRVRTEQVAYDGKTYKIPCAVVLDGEEITVGNGDNSLYYIEGTEFGHYTLYTRANASAEWQKASLPAGAAYMDVEVLSMFNDYVEQIRLNYYKADGTVVSFADYMFVGNSMQPCVGAEAVEVVFTSGGCQITLDGHGNAKVDVVYVTNSTQEQFVVEFYGTYQVAKDQKLGETLDVTLNGMSNTLDDQKFDMTLKLEAYFDGSYHKATLTGLEEEPSVMYAPNDREVRYNVNRYSLNDGYTFYDYIDGNGETLYRFVRYSNGSAGTDGTYVFDESIGEFGAYIITMNGTAPQTIRLVDNRGSFRVSNKAYVSYNPLEIGTFVLASSGGDTTVYFSIQMDGFGGATMQDMRGGSTVTYSGTYMNTGVSVENDAYGLPCTLYTFEYTSKGETVTVYFVPNTYYVYLTDSRVGSLLMFSYGTCTGTYTVYDENGREFGTLAVDPFGFEEGTVLTPNDESMKDKITCKALLGVSGEVAAVAVYDLNGAYLFRVELEENGDWVVHPEGAPELPEAEEEPEYKVDFAQYPVV